MKFWTTVNTYLPKKSNIVRYYRNSIIMMIIMILYHVLIPYIYIHITALNNFPMQTTSILDEEMINYSTSGVSVSTHADGTVLINGRRCTCNDNEFKGDHEFKGSSWTWCRCFAWLIPLLAFLTVSWSFDYMHTFRFEQAVLLLIVIYLYLCFFKYFGWLHFI